jgi:hypothetical protein
VGKAELFRQTDPEMYMCDCGEANKNGPHSPCPIHWKQKATNKEVMDLIVRHMQDRLFKRKALGLGDGN